MTDYDLFDCDSEERTIADAPLTESDLCARFNVKYCRTPNNEMIVIEGAHYEGAHEIEMQFQKGTYRAYVWSGYFHVINHQHHRNPMHALIEVRPERFDSLRLGHPIDAFKGKCEVLVDKHGNIVSVIQLSASEANYACDYQI
jgi:hypothetical protein